MISFKDYADKHHISYEAVRQSVQRYRAELEGHVHREGRTQYLDDEAEQFLDGKRKGNPVVIYRNYVDEEMQLLQEENKALLMKVTELQDALLKEKDRVAELQAERISLLSAKEPEPKRNILQRIFHR